MSISIFVEFIQPQEPDTMRKVEAAIADQVDQLIQSRWPVLQPMITIAYVDDPIEANPEPAAPQPETLPILGPGLPEGSILVRCHKKNSQSQLFTDQKVYVAWPCLPSGHPNHLDPGALFTLRDDRDHERHFIPGESSPHLWAHVQGPHGYINSKCVGYFERIETEAA